MHGFPSGAAPRARPRRAGSSGGARSPSGPLARVCTAGSITLIVLSILLPCSGAWALPAVAPVPGVRPEPSATSDIVLNLGRGPVLVTVPSSYRPGFPMPLILLLHGYNASGAIEESYVQLAPLAEEIGFLYAHPDGTMNPTGSRYWNATDACCDFFHQGVDDSGYLMAFIQAVAAQLTVDFDRVCLVGHSNGGFMAYRMACEHSETIAAIASLAGATYENTGDCAAAAPVHVLQIHGTADMTIRYAGGSLNGVPYPGAVATVQQWAGFGGCNSVPETDLPPLDLDASLPGDETTVSRYEGGCAANGSAELWTIVNGTHIPDLSANFGRLVIEFLLSHPKSPPTEASADLVVAGLHCEPNPFSGTTHLSLRLGAPAQVSLQVVDIAGRLVRTIVQERPLEAGRHELAWDGRSERGTPVAAGLYFLVLSNNGHTTATKVVRAR